MDIFDHYLEEEPDHLPFLKTFIENRERKSHGEIISNLFNFKANFVLNEIVVEDDAGLFCESEEARDIALTPKEMLKRIENAEKT